jgi:hypothetical protein
MKEGEICETCSSRGEIRNSQLILSGNPKRRNHLGDLGVDMRIVVLCVAVNYPKIGFSAELLWKWQCVIDLRKRMRFSWSPSTWLSASEEGTCFMPLVHEICTKEDPNDVMSLPRFVNIKTKLNSLAWVRERTIPRGQRGGSLRPYSGLSRPGPLLVLSSISSVVLTRLSGPLSRPTSQKIWQYRESNLDLWICSQELWPLYHRRYSSGTGSTQSREYNWGATWKKK